MGLPVPRGEIVRSEDDAVEAARRIGYPVVTKPIDGNHGRGVGLDLRDEGAVLETGRPYLIPLVEELALPPGIRARTNPKSSTGRLDVFTRVITDRNNRFDEIPAGYQGKLYLEVVPRSFAVRVEELLSLNQLRLVEGDARVSDARSLRVA